MESKVCGKYTRRARDGVYVWGFNVWLNACEFAPGESIGGVGRLCDGKDCGDACERRMS